MVFKKGNDMVFKKENNIWLGRHHSDESKRKMSETWKRLYKEGKVIPPNKGKHMSEESKRKLSLAKIGKHFSPRHEFKKGHQTWNKGKGEYLDSETRKRINEAGRIWIEKNGSAFKGKHHTKESIEKNKESHKLLWQNHDFREKMMKALNSKERTEKISQSKIKEWQDPLQREKRIRSYVKWRQKRPNKKELFLNDIIQANFPNEWLFNVNGEVIFFYKYVPDWINTNGAKKVILLHGIFWHLTKERFLRKNDSLSKEDIEKEFVEKYGRYGFSTLQIWEDELVNTQVIDKIKKFMEEKNEKIGDNVATNIVDDVA